MNWSLRALHCSFESVQFPFCGSRFVQHIYFFIFICYKCKTIDVCFTAPFLQCALRDTLRFCLISMPIYHFSTRLSHTHTFTLTFSKRKRFIFRYKTALQHSHAFIVQHTADAIFQIMALIKKWSLSYRNWSLHWTTLVTKIKLIENCWGIFWKNSTETQKRTHGG